MAKNVTIYGLSTADSRILYVGQTTQSPLSRLMKARRHAVESGASSPVSTWLREHELEEIKIAILEETTVDQRVEREKFWMLELKTLVRDGGLNIRLSFGWDGGRPDAAKYAAEMSRRLREDPELRERANRRLSEAGKQSFASDPSRREHLAEVNRRRYEDPAAREATAEAVRRALLRPETRENMAAAQHRRIERDGTTQLSAAGRKGGAKGGQLSGHRRWHEARGILKPGCPHCESASP